MCLFGVVKNHSAKCFLYALALKTYSSTLLWIWFSTLGSRVFTIFAGTPKTNEWGGMIMPWGTRALAPMMLNSPIWAWFNTVACMPMSTW